MPRISERDLNALGSVAGPSPGRIAAGREAMQRGASFEQLLDDGPHRLYRADGLAYIERHHLPTKATRLGDRIVHTAIGKAPFDFSGCLRSGRFVAIEAKASKQRNKRSEERLPIVSEKSEGKGVRREQLSALVELHQRFGAIVGLVWTVDLWVGVLSGHQLKLRIGDKSIPQSAFIETGLDEYLPAICGEYEIELR